MIKQVIMGQYYEPVNLDKKEFLSSYEYKNGAKLMEHSYIGNNFVEAVVKALSITGHWFQTRLVWAGDYMDKGIFLPPVTTSEDNTLYSYAVNNFEEIHPETPSEEEQEILRYLCNHTKKEFVDIKACPPDNDNWQVHPLPLLTCSGNGRGGGDFRGENDYVGKWAGDIISVSEFAPEEEWTEIQPNFKE